MMRAFSRTRGRGAIVGLIVGGLCAGTVGGCGISASTGGKKAAPVDIGAIIDETGANASVGADQLTGLQAYVNNVNKTGGVDGHTIDISVLDSQSLPTIAAQDYAQFASNTKIVTLIGPTFTEAATAVLPLTARDHLPDIAPIVTDTFKGPYFFRSIPSTSIDGSSLLQYLKKIGDTRVGLLSVNDGQGVTGEQDVVSAAPGLGINIVANQEYPANTLDPSVEIDKVKAADPSAYIVEDGDSLTRLTLVVRTMRELGITAPIGTTLPASSPTFVSGVQGSGSGVNGVFFWAFSAPGQNTNATEAAFQKVYQQTSANHAAADSFALIGAAWGETIVAAVKALATEGKPITRDSMETALANLEGVPTVLGTLNYKSTGHNEPFTSTVVIRYNSSGQQVLAYHS